MAIKPILCNGNVVRAILDGRQTQDRRPVKPQPWKENAVDIRRSAAIAGLPVVVESCMRNGVWNEKQRMVPKYAPGDTIWVRETFCDGCGGDACHRADTDRCGKTGFPACCHPWKPSIHMPKWACRLWLRVTDVRVQRIQDISIEDCIAEGLGHNETPCPVRADGLHSERWYDGEGCEACGAPPLDGEFSNLWESLYPGSWGRNDWVWVYEFERTERPAGWPTAD
ncbi:hypothetical protein [Desulfovibrio oxyclinae]|uniref:hypothetical protein n=1 Tax=Desulfovibrio oxyclinae TaxID=63560 RepID=UPI0003A463D8|nr:hypothetical protein [Desulfovibrio oxyclinae]